MIYQTEKRAELYPAAGTKQMRDQAEKRAREQTEPMQSDSKPRDKQTGSGQAEKRVRREQKREQAEKIDRDQAEPMHIESKLIDKQHCSGQAEKRAELYSAARAGLMRGQAEKRAKERAEPMHSTNNPRDEQKWFGQAEKREIERAEPWPDTGTGQMRDQAEKGDTGRAEPWHKPMAETKQMRGQPEQLGQADQRCGRHMKNDRDQAEKKMNEKNVVWKELVQDELLTEV